jgi:hypothetical protein
MKILISITFSLFLILTIYYVVIKSDKLNFISITADIFKIK